MTCVGFWFSVPYSSENRVGVLDDNVISEEIEKTVQPLQVVISRFPGV
jgi:hypothetical protein